MEKCKKNISRGCCFERMSDGYSIARNIPGAHKMEVFDYLQAYPDTPMRPAEIYEVRFKNTRKGFYENSTGLTLRKGDIVAVEGTPGVDIGLVSLVSDLVWKQMKRTGFRTEGCEFKKILRHVTSSDVEKWERAIAMEHATMIKSRQISASLGLDMKIGDVEYQGDGMKAIFYYIADGRVDFRELIKVLFDQFRVRVEMKQIGARQEAGRIGGISSCGRELCCSSWINHFSTIGIGAARTQDISPNPQKLAGQCGKLKCCLNYEVDVYAEARKSLPRVNAPLEAMDGSYHLVKTDILSGTMYFSPDKYSFAIMIPLSVAKVREIQMINQKGGKIERLEDQRFAVAPTEEPQIMNVVGQESLTRFDTKRGSGNGRNSGSGSGNGRRNASDAGNRSSNGRNAGSGERNGRSNNNNTDKVASSGEKENRGDANRGENRANREPRQGGGRQGDGRGRQNQGQTQGQVQGSESNQGQAPAQTQDQGAARPARMERRGGNPDARNNRRSAGGPERGERTPRPERGAQAQSRNQGRERATAQGRTIESTPTSNNE